MRRAQKPKHIQEVKELVGRSSTIILAHQKGLTVAESTAIRNQMRVQEGGFKVVKNRLMPRVLTDGPHVQLLEFFRGPVVMFCAADPVAAAKVSVKAAKELGGKITIIAALCDGKIVTLDEVKSLAVLPSLDVLRGQLVGLLTAVASKLAVLSREPAAMLARLVRVKPHAADSVEKSDERAAADGSSAESSFDNKPDDDEPVGEKSG